MASFDIICIGGAVRDFIFYTDAGRLFNTPENLAAPKMLGFEYGAKINPKEVQITFGGGAANTSVAFSRLGFKIGILTCLGEDEIGREIEKNLKTERVDISLIQKDKKTATGVSFIITTDKKEKEHIAFAYRGAAQNLEINNKKLKNITTRNIYLTSLAGKDWLKNLKETFAFAEKNGAKVMWNPGNFQLKAGVKVIHDYLKKTNILILNKDEAIELVLSGVRIGKRNPNFLNKPVYLLNILHEWGPKIVVVTDGKKGAWCYDGKEIYHSKIIKSKVINTTGVGDAFGSGFLAGYINEKGQIAKALKYGMVNSSSVLTKPGSQAGLLSKKALFDKI